MKSEIDLISRIEAYLNGELTDADRKDFEQLRQSDPAVDHQVVAHQSFVKQLSEYGMRKQLMADMEDIHSQINITAIESEVLPQTVRVKRLWAKHRFDLAVAASVAIFAVLTTLLSTGYFDKDTATKSNYIALKLEINSLKRSQNALIKNIKDKPAHGPLNPGQFGGTGFALSTDGLVVTSFHVIEGADSVYIQNTGGESFKVETVYSDPVYDVAILKIIDSNFEPFNNLPYTIKKSSSDLGEEVYTIGFPKDDIVLGRGFLSSGTGLDGDTTAYQVDMNVNPGNSGGPLLDNRGNVIGIIKGKQIKLDGAAFAIKSNYLLKAIESMSKEAATENFVLNKKNSLAGLSRADQMRKIQKYIFMVKAY